MSCIRLHGPACAGHCSRAGCRPASRCRRCWTDVLAHHCLYSAAGRQQHSIAAAIAGGRPSRSSAPAGLVASCPVCRHMSEHESEIMLVDQTIGALPLACKSKRNRTDSCGLAGTDHARRVEQHPKAAGTPSGAGARCAGSRGGQGRGTCTAWHCMVS